MLLYPRVITETSGLSTKVKVSGAWTNAEPKVKLNGTWTRVKKAYAKQGNSWKPTYEYESVFTFSATQHTNVDLDALSLDRYHNVRVVVPSGATLVASSTTTYALKTGTSHSAKITIENHGLIYGHGGKGGAGGYQYPSSMIAPQDGFSGGSAIHIESNITIINNGSILGGGGGAGGGEGTYIYRHAGGGGGGGGAPYGTGGAGKTANGSSSYNAASGAIATLTTGGAGGYGARAAHGEGLFYGGAGGDGGAIGVIGAAGGFTPSSVSRKTGVGSGGAAGAPYYNPSSFTIS